MERIRGGRECVWGTVTAWEPPGRVAFTWHPGHEPAQAMAIDVRFTSAGAKTRVELVHKGFERLGALARRAHRGYPIGWTYVLGLYAERRDAVMLLLRGLTAAMMAIGRMKKPPETQARGSAA